MIIGLVAEAEHGKTAVGDFLVKEKEFKKISFATPIKKMLIKANLCTYEECYINKTKRSRELLQKIGTDIFRKQIDKNYWIKKSDSYIQNLLNIGQNIVIDDIRFSNEACYVKKKGGLLVKLIRINNNGTKYQASNRSSIHDSEKFVKSIVCDFVLEAKTGQINKLIEGIKFILKGRL